MQNTIEILKEIISIPSYVDETHEESQLISYIIDFIKKHKPNLIIEEQVVENEALPLSFGNSRRNLFIHDDLESQVILFGHLDTVLPKGESTSPFEPKIEGDKLYGLGAVDMKSGIAIMLDILKNNHKPGVGYVFTVDEEYDFKGALALTQKYAFKPKLIINLEPTSFKILNGCRGITEFSFVVHGKAAHAGLKKLGINAIEKGVELVSKLQLKISEFDTPESGASSLNLAFLHGGMLKNMDVNGNAVLSDLGTVVPNYAKLNCEIRVANNNVDEKFIGSEIAQISSELGITISDLKFKFYLGSMFTPKSNLAAFEKAIIKSGEVVEYGDISSCGYYEVQMMQEKTGCDCLVFGAGPIEMSHAANEYVEISSIEKTQKVIETYIDLNS